MLLASAKSSVLRTFARTARAKTVLLFRGGTIAADRDWCKIVRNVRFHSFHSRPKVPDFATDARPNVRHLQPRRWNKPKLNTFANDMEENMKAKKMLTPLSAAIIAGSLVVIPVAGFAQAGGGAGGAGAAGGTGAAGAGAATGANGSAATPGVSGGAMHNSPYTTTPGSTMSTSPTSTTMPGTPSPYATYPNGTSTTNPYGAQMNQTPTSQCPAGSTTCAGTPSNTPGTSTPQ
jgi:hypothetical protein